MPTRLPLALALAASVAAAPALAHPDFSGRWAMDASHSDFAGGAAPTSRIDRIVQHDSLLTIDRIVELANGARQLHNYDLAIDGREHPNTVAGLEIRSTLHWEGDTLVIASMQAGPSGDVTAIDRWRLSPARDTLVIARRFSARGTEVAQRLVFLRVSE